MKAPDSHLPNNPKKQNLNLGFYIESALEDKQREMGIEVPTDETDGLAEQIAAAESNEDIIQAVRLYCQRNSISLDTDELIKIAQTYNERIKKELTEETELVRNRLLQTIDNFEEKE